MARKAIFRLFLVIQISLIGCVCDIWPKPYIEIDQPTLKWISFYDTISMSVFKDSLNSYDTLTISIKDTTRRIGSECPDKFFAKEVKIGSGDSGYIFLMVYNARIQFRDFLAPSDEDLGYYNTENEELEPYANYDAEINSNFSFHGKTNKVVIFTCKPPCASANFSQIIYSRESGLIRFTDKQGKRWVVK